MYKIVYTKTAIKDIPKLKAAHLDSRAKALIDLIKENPFAYSLTMMKSLFFLIGCRITVFHFSGGVFLGSDR